MASNAAILPRAEQLCKLSKELLNQKIKMKEQHILELNGEDRITPTCGRNMSSGGRQSFFSSRNARGRGWTRHKRGRGIRGARQAYPIPRHEGRMRQLHTYEMTSNLRDLVGYPLEGQYVHANSESQRVFPSWCLCGNCRVMQSHEENVCCRQTSRDCISMLPGFELVVQRALTLLVTRRRQRILSARESNKLNRRIRQAAYKDFVRRVYGRLGPGIRRVIPSCCVCRIRDHYPDSCGKYMGFRVRKNFGLVNPM